MKNYFLRDLLYILDSGTLSKNNQKIVFSCRSHYFESLKIQNGFLRDEYRMDFGKNAYRAVEIMPFNLKQIKQYVKQNLKNQDYNTVMNLLNKDDFLKSIVEKPLLMKYVSPLFSKISTKIS